MNLIEEGVTQEGAHKGVKIAKRVKCSLNCTTDTQRDDAKTLERDYKSG